MNETLLTLFVSALLSSTLLPGGSEALLLWYQHEGAVRAPYLLLAASSGNVLGGMLTVALGRLMQHRWRRKPRRQRGHERAERWLHRYGAPVLLLSWLPVIGDPLCLLAGWLRLAWLPVVLFMALGKVLRYTVLLFL